MDSALLAMMCGVAIIKAVAIFVDHGKSSRWPPLIDREMVRCAVLVAWARRLSVATHCSVSDKSQGRATDKYNTDSWLEGWLDESVS